MPSFDYSQFLTQDAADARYQALGGLGSSTPSTIQPDDAAAAGVSTSASRQDHKHAIVAAAASSIGTANAEGAATSFARSDHVHTGAALGTVANGYQQVTANQGPITTEVDLSGLSVTFTAVAGRRYRISAMGLFNAPGGTSEVRMSIKEGGTFLQTIIHLCDTGGGFETFSGSCIVTPTGGSHTYKLTAVRQSGTGTVNLTASSTLPAFILVEDIGT